MAFTKINEADYVDKGIRVKNNPLGLSVSEAQRAFDELPLDVIIPKVNELSNEIDEYAESTDIKIENLKARATNAEEALETKANKDNVIEKDNAEEYTPTEPTHPATKGYVDAAVNEKTAELGAGDMSQETYDPQGRKTDVYQYADEVAAVVETALNEHTHTADDVGAMTLYKSFESLGLGDYVFSETDLLSNYAAVAAAMPSKSLFWVQMASSGSSQSVPFNKSIKQKLIEECDFNVSTYYDIRFEKTGANIVNMYLTPVYADSNMYYAKEFRCTLRYTSSSSKLTPFVLTKNNQAFFGEHNKPNGSYTGDGSSTERQISIGGIGKMLLITSSIGFAVVTTAGAFGRKSTSATSFYANECELQDGVLILNTSDTLLNQSGTTYYWQLI